VDLFKTMTGFREHFVVLAILLACLVRGGNGFFADHLSLDIDYTYESACMSDNDARLVESTTS